MLYPILKLAVVALWQPPCTATIRRLAVEFASVLGVDSECQPAKVAATRMTG
jgi:hypothetical protein